MQTLVLAWIMTSQRLNFLDLIIFKYNFGILHTSIYRLPFTGIPATGTAGNSKFSAEMNCFLQDKKKQEGTQKTYLVTCCSKEAMQVKHIIKKQLGHP